ncbi:MAG TPA: hypothetical protein VM052_09320 [Candidatus Limnocylindrales bacterium]|nr:hypothetical protein [Candidatus Limnocylindrales bacterium]
MVQFFCMHPEHREITATNGRASDHLTVFEREWAYCARDAKLDGHQWELTGGITVAEVERFARQHDARREATAL